MNNNYQVDYDNKKWVKCKKNGHYYWFNTVTGESQWDSFTNCTKPQAVEQPISLCNISYYLL